MAAPTDLTVTLRDGRQLAVLLSGPEQGVPVVHHHGTPGCRIQSSGAAAACAERGLRYLTYTRAGGEGSTRNPGRSVGDVAADIADVLDAIGAERCIVTGKSGGGPHALATGALLPERVVAVVSIAGAMPYAGHEAGFLDGMGEDNVEEFGLALRGEAPLREFVLRHREALKDADAEALIADLASLLPDVDRAVLTAEVGEELVASIRGGVAVPDAWVDDDLAFVRDWGFDVRDIAVPTYVWQGSADLMVPSHHGEWLAKNIPGATAHLEPGEGHFSIAVGAYGRMLDEAMQHLQP